MTDTEKLIDEVRNHGEFENRGWMIEMIDRLADALEAEHKRAEGMAALRGRWRATISAPGFEETVTAEATAYHESACIYQAEAESARKTGERILADALRYRAAIHEALYDGYVMTETPRRILTRALNENGETDG